ncbi:hypothetical protein LOK49_LG10G00860 [Camellia lanceoleosa]|uniref:Uncharacterized protein n=1 Tax=Camellia lanceoleosa TaxID=1840588 RepID=A0ACC0GBG3_9ERIC|nr:hypothetical protein LOK49_LG10G00860 [Camellia lanceoleosa]
MNMLLLLHHSPTRLPSLHFPPSISPTTTTTTTAAAISFCRHNHHNLLYSKHLDANDDDLASLHNCRYMTSPPPLPLHHHHRFFSPPPPHLRRPLTRPH